MAFVNEKISEEDRSKYKIDEIDDSYIVGATKSRYWTIDREKNIYLRLVARGPEEMRYQYTWNFYWNDRLLEIELDLLDAKGKRGEPGWVHWKLRSIDLPSDLSSRMKDIIIDLKEALTVYKDAGIYSANTACFVTLDI